MYIYALYLLSSFSMLIPQHGSQETIPSFPCTPDAILHATLQKVIAC